ncbi:MAG: carbohydrate ABC transporter permease [Lachnospiraceae bacterium]|jgi:raffinose/stachyose/melibiose transport system permease protein|nr:carbohydrate ABC transporter permease [Lachnospiraceae bacterium]MDD4524910.1 carbohydrate ABC transporter permease [Lachnospiraceae bacterium]
MKKYKVKKDLNKVLIVLIVAVILIIDVYPIFWMISASFKQQYEWSMYPAFSLNKGFYFQNYIDAWTRGRMSTFFRNSLIYTLISLVFIVVFSTTVGFAVTKMNWKLKGFVNNYFQLGIMVPTAIALIPLFQIYNKLGWINSPFCLIVTYIAFGLSLSIFLITGYIKALPDEILEAAVIDGCGIYSLMWNVVVPLMKNAIVTVLVLQFFFKWNDLLFSMTFISDTNLKTVQTGLLYFSDEFGSKNWGAIFASVSMSIVPMLVLYTFLNKTIIEGMTAGAVKG